MTSLAFSNAVAVGSNAWHLSGWGLSAGDIIAITGVGRNVVTWLTTESQDNALLEFLKVAEKELRLRRGLLDTTALNKRWSQTITLLENGKRQDHRMDGLAENKLENICRFSWMMTLIVASLDVSCTSTTVQTIIVEFTARLFIDAILDADYLRHALPQHIQGWRSSSTVRNITTAARKAWNKLESQPNHHIPGFVPSRDADEIVRFLLWLTQGQKQTMSTTSSDVHSLARVLSSIGFDILHTCVDGTYTLLDLTEGDIVLTYSQNWMTENHQNFRDWQVDRTGMRIPLFEKSMLNEVVSLWPQPGTLHNDLRLIFDKGMAAASFLNIQACTNSSANNDLDFCIHFTSSTNMPVRRISTEVSALVDGLVVLASAEASHALDDLIARWPPQLIVPVVETLAVRGFLPRSTPRRSETRSRNIQFREQDRVLSEMDSWELQQLRVFLLGYYYGALYDIIDTTDLRIKEGFGSWGWRDVGFFEKISAFVRSRMASKSTGASYWRFEVMKIVAYFFAGAEHAQLSTLKHGTAGVLAKLSVITPGVLGNADTPSKIKMFHLLDTDQTFFPSNQRGIVVPADQEQCITKIDSTFVAVAQDERLLTLTSEPDFTAHIEPAWTTDTTLCQVVYRCRGRLVSRVNPLEAEAAVLRFWAGNESEERLPQTHISCEDIMKDFQCTSGLAVSHSNSSSLYIAQPLDFQGGTIKLPLPEPRKERNSPDIPLYTILLATAAKPLARTCIAAMYCHQRFDRGTFKPDYDWTTISAQAMIMQHEQSILIVMT